MSTDFDILIVGAGMVGAALACALAPSGARIALLEQAPLAPFDPAAPPDLRVSALNFASERVLEEVGAWARILQLRACPYRRLAVWEKLHHPFSQTEVSSRFNRTCFEAAQVGQPHLGHIVENRVIQHALQSQAQQFANVSWLCPVQIVRADLLSQPPQVTLADGQTLTAALIVGADGAQSRVRQWAQIGEFADAYAQHALVATVEIEGPQQDITWQAFTATGPLAFLPLSDVGGRSYASLVWYHQAAAIPELLALDDASFIEAAAKAFPRELPPMRSVLGRGSFPLVKRHALQYARPGVVLVGDAAHTINPLAGQGVNLGFKDIATLSRILLDAHRRQQSWSDFSLLQHYQRERRSANQMMMNIMDLFYHGFSTERGPLKLLRNLGLTAASLAKPAHRPVIAYAMGLRDDIAGATLPKFLRDRLAQLG